MKKILTFTFLLAAFISLQAQCQEYQFRKPVLTGSTWKFSSVVSGIDAYITPVASLDATVNTIDDSTVYPYAWQPFIQFTRTVTNGTDSCYVEFDIEFRAGTNPDTQNCLTMTIVDLDGTSTYRELVKSSLPVTGKSNVLTSVMWLKDPNWYSFWSNTSSYSTIDTANFDAMIELNYTNVQKYRLRVGSVGNITSSTIRQYSFYFKHFDSLLLPLPVKWINVSGELLNDAYSINWTINDITPSVYHLEQYNGSQWTVKQILDSYGLGLNEYSAMVPVESSSSGTFRIRQIAGEKSAYSQTITVENTNRPRDEVFTFYNGYGIAVFTGTFKDFVQVAQSNEFYFTNTGKKYTVLNTAK